MNHETTDARRTAQDIYEDVIKANQKRMLKNMNTQSTSDTPETDAKRNDVAGSPTAIIDMTEHARKLERERDEWQLHALMKMAVKQLACMWCGEIVHAPTGYEPGTPLSAEQRGQAYREHVATCTAHPIRDVERERDEALNALKPGGMLDIIARAAHDSAAAIRELDEARETRARMADIRDKLVDLRKALNRRPGSLLEKQITDAAICLTNTSVEAHD